MPDIHVNTMFLCFCDIYYLFFVYFGLNFLKTNYYCLNYFEICHCYTIFAQNKTICAVNNRLMALFSCKIIVFILKS